MISPPRRRNSVLKRGSSKPIETVAGIVGVVGRRGPECRSSQAAPHHRAHCHCRRRRRRSRAKRSCRVPSNGARCRAGGTSCC
eukprot:5226628-Prymnesium_polylepis.1